MWNLVEKIHMQSCCVTYVIYARRVLHLVDQSSYVDQCFPYELLNPFSCKRMGRRLFMLLACPDTSMNG